MARIGTESRRMGALVDDLLLLARLDQGRPLRHDPVDLSRIADDAVADARAARARRGRSPPRSSRRGHRDGRRGPPAPGRSATCSPTSASTRRPATPVEVVARGMDGDVAELRVVDHGPGIDRVTSARRSSTASTAPIPAARATAAAPGLGLSIAASVARRTAAGSGTRRRPAAARRSWSGSGGLDEPRGPAAGLAATLPPRRSQQTHSRNTGRLQRTRPACSQFQPRARHGASSGGST